MRDTYLDMYLDMTGIAKVTKEMLLIKKVLNQYIAYKNIRSPL